jgi:hypothetical protein
MYTDINNANKLFYVQFMYNFDINDIKIVHKFCFVLVQKRTYAHTRRINSFFFYAHRQAVNRHIHVHIHRYIHIQII